MKSHPAGYREVEHTADWELEVWAPDLPALLEQAARGMYALSGVTLRQGEPVEQELFMEAADAESLMVAFLSELLFLTEAENMAFEAYYIDLDGYALHARLKGGKVEQQSKEIKAVTYHRLEIRSEGGGLRVNVVFDV